MRCFGCLDPRTKGTFSFGATFSYPLKPIPKQNGTGQSFHNENLMPARLNPVLRDVRFTVFACAGHGRVNEMAIYQYFLDIRFLSYPVSQETSAKCTPIDRRKLKQPSSAPTNGPILTYGHTDRLRSAFDSRQTIRFGRSLPSTNSKKRFG